MTGRDRKPVVIITGVNGGIGLETAKVFSGKGWLVVGTVRPGRDRSGFQDELAAAAVDVQLAEMTNQADLEQLVRRTLTTYRRIDAVILNAGYGLWGRLESLSAAQITHQLAVNTVAAAELSRLVIPAMRKGGGGVIVALSSMAGRFGLPDAPAYAASKFALEGIMESLWYQLAGDNIRVRLIEPGPVDSQFWRHRVWGHMARLPKRSWPALEHSLTSRDVAEKIYQVCESSSQRLRYPLGVARLVAAAKRLLPEQLLYRLTVGYYKRKKKRLLRGDEA